MFLARVYFNKLVRVNFLVTSFLLLQFFSLAPSLLAGEETESLLGPRVNKNTIWVGNRAVSSSIPILIMAGHADSQDMKGEGTAGESVALMGYSPMDRTMSDELFWNLKIRDAVVKLGSQKGLKIDSYDPGIRTIRDENHEKTNWSVGSRRASKGEYVLEIHFDSYGQDGLGSGLIPALSTKLNNIDESLAQTFGRYPLFFRGGLGAPRRQIRVLEIGKLEGNLEKNLRDINSRQKTIDQIAKTIVDAILMGINKKDSFSPRLPEGDILIPDFYQ